MSTFSLKIISTDKVFYDGKCEYLVIPTIDGEKGILAHHENMVIAVEIGELRFRKPDGEWVTAVVSKGFAEIVNNRASVLVNTAERPEDIDVKRAEEAKERAEEQLRQKQSIQEYYLSQASMARAMTRLKASRNRVVSKGFAEIVNNRASVLVNTAERPEDIDVKRAEEAKERAEEQLRQKQSIQEYYLSQASMARAMTRLKASRNRRGDI